VAQLCQSCRRLDERRHESQVLRPVGLVTIRMIFTLNHARLVRRPKCSRTPLFRTHFWTVFSPAAWVQCAMMPSRYISSCPNQNVYPGLVAMMTSNNEPFRPIAAHADWRHAGHVVCRIPAGHGRLAGMLCHAVPHRMSPKDRWSQMVGRPIPVACGTACGFAGQAVAYPRW
jgi:hypothetical protein